MSETEQGLIQRYPRGYLGLLGAQTNGTTPRLAGAVVAPVVDISPFLQFGSVKVASTTVNINAVGYAVGLGPGSAGVASDQAWAVLGYGLRSNAALGAATTIRATPANLFSSGTAFTFLSDPVSFTVGEQATWGRIFDEPLLLSFNESVGFFVNSWAGLATACTYWVRYVTLETQ